LLKFYNKGVFQKQELTGWSQLEGPFEDSYTAADNTKLVPTETQKNSFYALSKVFFIWKSTVDLSDGFECQQLFLFFL
tara:strand:+ start:683 stop:916 length:234 start_codon:yes stop_codon:yes gene_type:complete